MPAERKNLFIGLAKRSTGEATYMVRQLAALSTEHRVSLLINRSLEGVVAEYIGDKAFHELTGMPFGEILRSLESVFRDCANVTLIDLNCFFLECNIRPEQRSELFALLERTHSGGVAVSLVDYFGSCTLTEHEHVTRLSTAHARLERKIRGLPTTSRLGYYLRKFIPERMEMQLIPPLTGPVILRPVPINRGDPATDRVLGYMNLLDVIPRTRERKDRRTVFFGLSRFFEYTVEHPIIRNLCAGIFVELKKVLDINRIVCIDPFSCVSGIDLPDGLELETHAWLKPEELDRILDESLFAGLFVPYGTVGTIALNRGVPFVSFYASESSMTNENFRALMKGQSFPGFHALGIWEDEAYFPDLARDNPYFGAVSSVDICDPDSFARLAEDLESGAANERVRAYQDWLATVDVLPFSSCLDRLYARSAAAGAAEVL